MVTNLSPWESAQQAVLGSVLIKPSLTTKVLGETKAEYFDNLHRPVWVAISECYQEGKEVDPVIISDKLGGDITSRQLMWTLMEVTPTAAHVDSYIEILKEQSQLQVCRELGSELSAAVSMDDCRELIGKISAASLNRPSVKISSLGDLAVEYMERQDRNEEKDYLCWPLPELEKTLYIEPGSFVFIGGYPSEGKTAFALQCAAMQAKKKKIGFFSYETSREKLYDRLIAHMSKIPLSKIKHSKEMDDDERFKVIHTLQATHNLPMQIIEAGGLTVRDIQTTSEARQYDVIYIDYLQLIQPDNPKDLRHEQVARISRALHTMAQTTGITIICLSQLSRPDKGPRPKQKKGEEVAVAVPEPTMSDLRESGQLEQDADAIMLIWRPYPDGKDTDRRLKLAKNKEGVSGKKLVLAFDGATQTFSVKDPRTWGQRLQDAGKSGKAKWAAEAKMIQEETQNEQIGMEEIPDADPDLPFK